MNYTYKDGVFYCGGIQLSSLGDYFYKLGNTLYYSSYHYEKNYTEYQSNQYEIEKRIEEWGEGPENDGYWHPAYEGYDRDEYIYGQNSCENETIDYNYPKGDIEVIEVFKEEYGDFFCESHHYLYKITNIIPEDFFVIGKGYLKVKNEIFYNLKRILLISAKTFNIIDDEFAIDEKNVYRRDSLEDDYGNKFYTGELQIFKILRNEEISLRGGNYISDGVKIYLKPDTNKILYQGTYIYYYLEVAGVDIETFYVISNHFARDKNTIYFLGDSGIPKKVDDVDLSTFNIREGDFLEVIGEDNNYKYIIEQDYTLSKLVKRKDLLP